MLRPKNQKFKVTAKGGDRTKRFVEWPLMRFCLLLLLLNVAGILSSWIVGGILQGGDSGIMALVWSWYNLVVLTVACFVCIELPRLRRSERMAITGSATIAFASGRIAPASLRDLSILGARLGVEIGPRRGERATLVFGPLRISGEVVRQSTGEIAIRFDDTFENRKATIQCIYGRKKIPVFDTVKPVRLGFAVMTRLFR